MTSPQIVLVAVVSLILLGGCAEKDAEIKPIPMKVEVGELLSKSRDNELAADASYNGKFLEVTGSVEKVGKDGIELYVELGDKKKGFWGIFTTLRCEFPESHHNELANLHKGEDVTIRGMCGKGWFSNHFVLDNCILVHENGSEVDTEGEEKTSD